MHQVERYDLAEAFLGALRLSSSLIDEHDASSDELDRSASDWSAITMR